MMKRSHLLSVTVIGGFIYLAGCQDEAAQARAQEAAALQDAATEYSATVLTNPDLHMASHDSAATAKLGAIAGRGGSGPASSMLDASVQTDLALATLAEAEAIAANNRAARTEARGLVDAARVLKQQAARHTAALNDSETRVLEAARSQTQQQLDTARTGLNQLQGPIASLEQQIAANRQRIQDLRAQSRAQREQAFDAGDLEGYPYIVEAVRIDGDADTLERRTADLEIELGQLQAQRAMLQAMVEQDEKALQTYRTTASELQSNADYHRQEAQRLAAEASTFEQQAQTKMGEIRSRMTGPLNDLFGSAAQYAEQASMKASSAGASNAGRMMKVRALQMRARAYTSKMRDIVDHAMLVALAGQSTSEFVTAYREASEMAKAAYTEALETLGQGAGDVSASVVNELRANLQSGISSASMDLEALLSGAEMPDITMPNPPSNTGSGGTTTGGGADMGNGK